jgi:cytochrome c
MQGILSMINITIPLTTGLLAAISTFAGTNTGDVTKGEAAFKKCKACHGITADNGKGAIIVKGGKIGPNLWGVIGRQAGSYPEYKFGKSIVAAGDAGFLWDETGFFPILKTKKYS